jgi:hypothetical protein
MLVGVYRASAVLASAGIHAVLGGHLVAQQLSISSAILGNIISPHRKLTHIHM